MATKKISQPEQQPQIAGQLLIWNKGPHAALTPGRVGLQIFGVLSTPAEIAAAFTAHSMLKHLIAGRYDPGLGLRLSSVVGLEEAVEEPWASRGYTIDQLITAPIWRA